MRGGTVVMPNLVGRCGRCGGSSFEYSNGHEVADDGTRGYRCNGCGAVKPENWRELLQGPTEPAPQRIRREKAERKAEGERQLAAARAAAEERRREEEERREAEGERGTFYVSTYCNFAHRLDTGRPVKHECRIIPPAALRAEMAGDFSRAIELMEARRR